ncbi:MAG: nitroreductase [Anaerolineae bacterium]
MTDVETVDRTIQARRSTRVFTPQPVSRETIEHLLDVARWAPSGSNSQQWRVTVASGAAAEDLRKRLREAATTRSMTPVQSESFRQRIASGPMAWILDCVQEPIDQYLTQRSMTFYDAPVALVVTYPGAAHAPVPAGVPAFVTTLMLAAEARGLGTIWLGWPLGRPEIVRGALAIPEEEQLGAFVALGYPDSAAPVNQARSPRDPVSSFTRWIGWD